MIDDKYILDRHTPVPCEDLVEWGRWFQSAERHVGNDWVGDVHVSTVFLALDHHFGGGLEHVPILFETMIFGGEHDQYTERYATWDEALEGHQRALAMVKGETA